MTNKQYKACVEEATEYTDRDAYVSDLALSSMLGDDPESQNPQERLEQIGSIYDAVHRSVKDIAASAGMSQRKLAERFCIPYRTVEDWSAKRYNSPLYVRLMMQECLGLLNIDVQ